MNSNNVFFYLALVGLLFLTVVLARNAQSLTQSRVVSKTIRFFRRPPLEATALELAYLELCDTQRDRLHYKAAEEDNRASVEVTKRRLARLKTEQLALQRNVIRVDVRKEIMRTHQIKQGRGVTSALEEIALQIEREQKKLLTFQTEAEEAAGQVIVHDMRIPRLIESIRALEVEHTPHVVEVPRQLRKVSDGGPIAEAIAEGMYAK